MFMFKQGVDTSNATRETWFAMGVLYALYGSIEKNLTVTAGRDGKHEVKSKHYSGEAFDVRIREITPEQRKNIVDAARVLLDPLGYDVVSIEDKAHQDHDHIEFDPKSGEQWVRTTS